MKGIAGAALLAVAVAISGCKPDAAIKQAQPIGRGMKVGQGAPPDPASAAASPAVSNPASGSVTGTIHFAGRPPQPLRIDMSMDPACGMSGGGENFAEQFVVSKGGLANVYLYLKDPPAALRSASAVSSRPTVLDQKGCRYTPHVIAIMAGGMVEFRNSDVTMHNIHTMPVMTGNEGIDLTQGPRGKPQIKQFNHAEIMLPVRCNVHPWMNAFINVAETPFFAVSDANGSFEIKGLPAGTYTLAAVHEKLGEQVQTITVSASQPAKADFTYTIK